MLSKISKIFKFIAVSVWIIAMIVLPIYSYNLRTSDAETIAVYSGVGLTISLYEDFELSLNENSLVDISSDNNFVLTNDEKNISGTKIQERLGLEGHYFEIKNVVLDRGVWIVVLGNDKITVHFHSTSGSLETIVTRSQAYTNGIKVVALIMSFSVFASVFYIGRAVDFLIETLKEEFSKV